MRKCVSTAWMARIAPWSSSTATTRLCSRSWRECVYLRRPSSTSPSGSALRTSVSPCVFLNLVTWIQNDQSCSVISGITARSWEDLCVFCVCQTCSWSRTTNPCSIYGSGPRLWRTSRCWILKERHLSSSSAGTSDCLLKSRKRYCRSHLPPNQHWQINWRWSENSSLLSYLFCLRWRIPWPSLSCLTRPGTASWRVSFLLQTASWSHWPASSCKSSMATMRVRSTSKGSSSKRQSV